MASSYFTHLECSSGCGAGPFDPREAHFLFPSCKLPLLARYDPKAARAWTEATATGPAPALAAGRRSGGTVAAGGCAATGSMVEGQAEVPGVFPLRKSCVTWLSAWIGVPAGVFAPSLTIGAGIGHDIALLTGLGDEAAIPLIALGMVGFLAATTQGPITAFIIVMEMVSGHSMVLSLMASALLASAVARLLTKPMYLELAALLPIPASRDTVSESPTPPRDGAPK